MKAASSRRRRKMAAAAANAGTSGALVAPFRPQAAGRGKRSRQRTLNHLPHADTFHLSAGRIAHGTRR